MGAPVVAKRLVQILVPLIVIGGACALAFSLYAMKATPETRDPGDQTPSVEVAVLAPYDGSFDIVADGVVTPVQDIAVPSEVAGRVAFKCGECREGFRVEKGQVLVEIDDRDLRLEKQRAEFEIAQADSSLDELAVQIQSTEGLVRIAADQVRLAEAELARWRRSGVSTQGDIDKQMQAINTAKNAHLQLEQQLSQMKVRQQSAVFARDLAKSRLEGIELDLTRTKIVAPATGVVVEDLVEENAYVQPGTNLFTIQDSSKMEVTCRLRMDQLFWIWQQAPGTTSDSPFAASVPATPTTITYELMGRRFSWEGVLTRYDGAGLEERTRTIPCVVVVDDPGAPTSDAPDAASIAGPRELLRNMFVEVRIHANPDLELFALPERAIQPGKRVWFVEDGKLVSRPVDVVQVQDGVAVIDGRRGGVAAGAQAVVSPLVNPADGMAVNAAS
ncbi:MAG TPA: HlyD family efflux transporter periplasmic adaptor subunit [Pirellulaceae bacterium]|jgi:multidrug efflux pump subunit AcrA (membrane-fusion protein)|nr:HlyD family efflux transporter periplasmic adaptor subunit [Pirellulaceae bacterium]